MEDDNDSQRDEFPLHSVLQAIEFQKQRLGKTKCAHHSVTDDGDPDVTGDD